MSVFCSSTHLERIKTRSSEMLWLFTVAVSDTIDLCITVVQIRRRRRACRDEDLFGGRGPGPLLHPHRQHRPAVLFAHRSGGLGIAEAHRVVSVDADERRQQRRGGTAWGCVAR
jgi:hypothetical protein